MRYKYKGYYRKRGTLGLFFYDNEKDRVVAPCVQLSLVDPWWIPKYDRNYFANLDKKYGKKRGYGWLAGWLFFYFGVGINERNKLK